MLSLPASKFAAIFSAMSKEGEEMPSMCGVRVERFDSTLTIAATNGHWLLRWREVEGQTDENGEVIDRTPFAVTIPRRVLGKRKRSARVKDSTKGSER